MANSDKDIVITPNRGSASSDPSMRYTGGNATVANSVNVYMYADGTLSYEGTAGQLFSVSNSMVGTIFSVNDVSGVPSIEVLDTGAVKLAPYNGTVGIGTPNPSATNQLDIYDVDSSGSGMVRMNGPAGYYRMFNFASSGTTRWMMGVSNAAEGGGGAGSDFFWNRYSDAGAYQDTPLSISRSTGQLVLATLPKFPSGGASGQALITDGNGNLSWGTPSATWNGGTVTNPVTFTNTVAITNNTPSTLYSNGALVIGSATSTSAGLGVYGNVRVGGNVSVVGNLAVAGTSNTTIGGNVVVAGNVLTRFGTASNPSYSFTSDPSTGMYLSSAGTMILGVSGTTAMTLTSSSIEAGQIFTSVKDLRIGNASNPTSMIKPTMKNDGTKPTSTPNTTGIQFSSDNRGGGGGNGGSLVVAGTGGLVGYPLTTSYGNASNTKLAVELGATATGVVNIRSLATNFEFDGGAGTWNNQGVSLGWQSGYQPILSAYNTQTALYMNGNINLIDRGTVSSGNGAFNAQGAYNTNASWLICNNDSKFQLAMVTNSSSGATKSGTYLTVSSGGNLGIGTETPTYKLDVNGDLIAGWVRTRGDTGWYSESYGGGWYMIDTTYLRAYNNKSILTGGNMTAANFTATSNMNAAGMYANYMYAKAFFDSDNTAFYVDPSYISFLNDVRASIIYDRDNTGYYLDPNGTSVMNVLYATIMYDLNDSTNYYVDPSGISYMNDIRPFIMYDRDNTGYYVNPNGTSNLNEIYANVLRAQVLYDTNDPTYLVDPNGVSRMHDIYADYLYSYGNVVAFSDRRLKKNVERITDWRDIIKGLNSYRFEWNEIGDKMLGGAEKGTQVGLIAQEVQAVLPQAATVQMLQYKRDMEGNLTPLEGIEHDPDDPYLTIIPERLIPVLVEAVKGLSDDNESKQAEIDALNLRVDGLTKMMEALMARISALEEKR